MGEHVATVRRPTFVASIGFLVVCYFGIVHLGWSRAEPDSVSDFIGVGTSTAVVMSVMWTLAVHSSIRVHREGLVVTNILVRHRVPWCVVRGVELDDGLKIRVRHSNLGSVQFGESLLGTVTGYPTYRRSVDLLEQTRRRYQPERDSPAAGSDAAGQQGPREWWEWTFPWKAVLGIFVFFEALATVGIVLLVP